MSFVCARTQTTDFKTIFSPNPFRSYVTRPSVPFLTMSTSDKTDAHDDPYQIDDVGDTSEQQVDDTIAQQNPAIDSQIRRRSQEDQQ